MAYLLNILAQRQITRNSPHARDCQLPCELSDFVAVPAWASFSCCVQGSASPKVGGIAVVDADGDDIGGGGGDGFATSSFGISGIVPASAADVELYVDTGLELQQLVLDEMELSVTGAVCSEGHLTALSLSSDVPLSLALAPLSCMPQSVAAMGVAGEDEIVAVGGAGSTSCGIGESSDFGDPSVNVSNTIISLHSSGL